MTIIEWPQFLENGLPPNDLYAVTVGVFDGIHRGHQALIGRVVSHNPQNVPVVITFRQNHKAEKHTGNIQSFRQKTAVFDSLGLKIMIVVDFTESFRRMSGIEFLELLLKRGNVGFLAVGSNFRCGYGLDTNAAAIRQFFTSRSIPVEIVPEVTEGQLPVSSSRIRSAITGGNLRQVQMMLDRPYTIDLAHTDGISPVLPPPGRYQVILREGPADLGTKAEIVIEGEAVRVSEPFADSRWEYAEFCYEDSP